MTFTTTTPELVSCGAAFMSLAAACAVAYIAGKVSKDLADFAKDLEKKGY